MILTTNGNGYDIYVQYVATLKPEKDRQTDIYSIDDDDDTRQSQSN